jgi:hypothetical protein
MGALTRFGDASSRVAVRLAAMFRRALLIAIFPWLAAFPVAADNWFVQTDAGVTRLKLDQLEDNDPVGAVFTANRTDGTGIIPRSVRQPNLGFAGAVSVGRLIDQVPVRLTYRHFGAGTATASGLFFSNPFDNQVSPSFPQSMRVRADALFLGTGYQHRFGGGWFVELTAEAGAAFQRANGLRDIGTELQQPYPTARRINLAYGAGASLGFQLTDALAILAGANRDHLGRVQTGFNPDIGRGPEAFLASQQLGLIPASALLPPPHAALRIKGLSAATIALGLRYGF